MKRKRSNNDISKKLREQNRSNDYFELMLNNLTLEEALALKLELAFKTMGFKPLSLPVWNNHMYIFKEAILRAALSLNKGPKETADFLGIPYRKLHGLLVKYNLKDPD